MREADPDPARDFIEAKELWGDDDEEASREVNFNCIIYTDYTNAARRFSENFNGEDSKASLDFPKLWAVGDADIGQPWF